MGDYISFPGLGITIPASPVICTFPFFGTELTIRWYGLLIAIGFSLAVIYGMKRAPQFGLNRDRMIDVILVSTVLAFIGARLYYVFFFNWDEYKANPLSIFEIWNGGLAIYGGVIVAFIAGLLMCRLRKVDPLRMFDLAAIGFLIGQGIGRWGNFFNQEAFGGNTNLPWGMTGNLIAVGQDTAVYYDPSLPVHPTFLYESLWCLLGFLLLHFLSKKAYKFKGELFCTYLMWYGTGRFFIEGLRTDSLYVGTAGLRVSQLVAVLSVIAGFVLLLILRQRSRRLPDDLFATASEEALTPTAPEAAELAGDAEDTAVEDTDAVDETTAQAEETDTDEAAEKTDKVTPAAGEESEAENDGETH